MKKRRLRKYLSRQRLLVYFCFKWTGLFLNLWPRRLIFLLLVIADAGRIPFRHLFEIAYLPHAARSLTAHPMRRFSSACSRLFVYPSARVLYGIGAYREMTDWISANGLAVISTEMNKLLLQALFESGEFRRAYEIVIANSLSIEVANKTEIALLSGLVGLVIGEESKALENLNSACRAIPSLMRPHQNIAAKLEVEYTPNDIDRIVGSKGRLFDFSNYTGQRVTHVGRGDLGIPLFARALATQDELRASLPPPLSPELTRLLNTLGIAFQELRIIPAEWTTQIGHLGMLDILFRMRELGWWKGKALFVIRSESVANPSFFRLYEKYGKILTIGGNISKAVGEELLSLQRWCGMNFNAFQLPTGEVVAWQEAGALAILQWEREMRGCPVRDEFDRIFNESSQVRDNVMSIRGKWGMKDNDWYVCLHTRDASHHLEFSGTGQTHRNADLESYMSTISHITSQGGWVIRLGGPRAPQLPAADRVIDYAHSAFKSDLMDLYLIRNTKMFIGTTSGLTNVAISFGVPSAIVNCITTDAQLWSSNLRFALKPVLQTDGTMITQKQLTSSPWRWRVFDATVLGRHGAHPVNNSPDEILQTVREVEALANGASAQFESEYDVNNLLGCWTNQLDFPHFYGGGRPSLYYLGKYADKFLHQE